MKRALKIVAALIGVLVIGIAVGLRVDPVPPENNHPIDLAALRSLAGEKDLPVRVNALAVGGGWFPRSIVVGGLSRDIQPITFFSYQVVYPDGGTGIIDTALDAQAVSIIPSGQIDTAAYQQMQGGLDRARFVVITHEHMDHIGGLARAQHFDAVASHTLITREQLSSPFLKDSKMSAEQIRQLKPLEYGAMYAVAPGVALLKAAGHTPGSQMVYVRLADGRELLFAGDIAWSEDNLRLQRTRPFLCAGLLIREDRDAIRSQIRALIALRESSGVNVVVGHDAEQVGHYQTAGLLGRTFE